MNETTCKRTQASDTIHFTMIAVLTMLLAFVSVTASAIDEYQFHSGTAVLKGRILNKPADVWNIVSVRAYDLFTDQEQIYTIPVAKDGTFEGSIALPHSQSVLVQDISDVFLAVGDTVEVTKDATQDDYEGVTLGGHGTSADINRLWPEVKKHYFGNRRLFINGLAKEDIPKWKNDMVKLMDIVIADMETDRLPLPAGTNAYIKEVVGASLLGELLMAIMMNYRYNMTEGGYYNFSVADLGEYYDFLAWRERWLLDNPAMLLVTKDPSFLITYVGVYIMTDISMMRNRLILGTRIDDSPNDEAYKTEMALPRDFDAEQHRRMLKMRHDTLFTISDYYRQASEAVMSRYGLKRIGFMQQMVLYLNHEEWLLLCGKFQSNAVPFCLAVDKDGTVVTHDVVDKYIKEWQDGN